MMFEFEDFGGKILSVFAPNMFQSFSNPKFVNYLVKQQNVVPPQREGVFVELWNFFHWSSFENKFLEKKLFFSPWQPCSDLKLLKYM